MSGYQHKGRKIQQQSIEKNNSLEVSNEKPARAKSVCTEGWGRAEAWVNGQLEV